MFKFTLIDVRQALLELLFSTENDYFIFNTGGVRKWSAGESYGWPVSQTDCSEGCSLCSAETERALLQDTDCSWGLYWPWEVKGTLSAMIESMCSSEVSQYYTFVPSYDYKTTRRGKFFYIPEKVSKSQKAKYELTKLNPIDWTGLANTISMPMFEQTRGRYPWICSMRLKSTNQHLCGTTILSRPPGPLVMVTAAHCVFLCKTEDGNTKPNCCCENVSDTGCSADSGIDCGTNPRAEVMTGEDAEVICGEFEIGKTEDSDLLLEIEEITAHPDYNISRGVNNSQYVIADIATIKVNENLSQEQISTLTPVCLPGPQDHNSMSGVHAGWSSPPPNEYLPDSFAELISEFSKMWHYNMSLTECQDPTRSYSSGFLGVGSGLDLQYPTNSYYPPGTICAREKEFKFCPTSGESGSPLMVEDREGKFSVVGINSFIKGCSVFEFYDFSENEFLDDSLRKASFFNQASENPSVYTRLSCFLGWVADQYNMTFQSTEEDHLRCEEGTGDITEVGGDQCKTSPNEQIDISDKTEASCIFPYYLDGKEYDQCTLIEREEFSIPKFVCPIRTVKGRGKNFTTDDVGRNYCPTDFPYTPVINPYNGEWELDPDNSNCPQYDVWQEDGDARPVFATCKNTCPGGKTRMII